MMSLHELAAMSGNVTRKAQVFVMAVLLMVARDNSASAVPSNVNVTSIGPEGGMFASLVIDPQNPLTLYAGAYQAGVFKTTDGGSTWSYSGLAGLTVNTVVVDPTDSDSLYASTYFENDGGDVSNVGIFKSTDGAKTWTTAGSNFPTKCSIGGLEIDPRLIQTLYAWTYCDGVFRTTDAGQTWQAVNSGLPAPGAGSGFNGFAMDPHNPDVLYVVAVQCDQSGKRPPPACDSQIFKSADQGENWSGATSQVGGYLVGRMVIDPGNSDMLYAQFTWPYMQNGVARSIDGGNTWSAPVKLIGGCCLQGIVADPGRPGTVYVYGFGTFKSTDSAESWTPVYPPPAKFAAMVVDPQNGDTLYAAAGSILKSPDGGASWNAANSGLRAIQVLSMAIDPQGPNTLYAGTYFGPFKSTDGGKNWSAINSNGGMNFQDTSVVALAVDPQNRGTVYAGAEGDDCAGVFKTVDAGMNWINAGLVNCITGLLIDPQNPDTIYAATLFRGILKSIDGGGSWTEINSGLPGVHVSALALDSQNPQVLYVGVQSPAGLPDVASTLFKSTDGGLSWNPTALTAAGSFVTGIVVDPQDPSALYALIATSPFVPGRPWKSTDGGTSWRDLSPVLPSPAYALAVAPRNPSLIYAGIDIGVVMSADGGESWASVASNIGPTHLLVLDPKDQTILYAGGPGGLFEIAPPAVTAIAFDKTVVKTGISYIATIAGSNLNSGMYFDVQMRSPGSAADVIVLNWQTGVSASHFVPAGTPTGTWTIDGLRAHLNETDHSGIFTPVSATISVAP
jgi:photosystem II stability/assembly factor-like uncharacterized protein